MQISLVSKSEIARRLGVSRYSITKFVEQGMLPRPWKGSLFYNWPQVEEAFYKDDAGDKAKLQGRKP